MLNPSEVHLLVGLLTQVSQPEAAEVTLGEMVYNDASQTKRDLDITVKYQDPDGKSHVFIGLEVKAHRLPLDSPQVEQLCAKLNTHKNVKERGIISASGYTKPAIKTAKYHNIPLYNLVDWDINKVQFDHCRMTEQFRLVEYGRTTGKPFYKMLTKIGDDEFKVGCVLTEWSMGNLVGITVSHADRTIRFINITKISREKKKIYNIKLK